MATLFSDIYEIAISKFNDYGLLELGEVMREDILQSYLNSAQARFQRTCKVNLSDRDDDLEQYNADLDLECKEILATGMTYFWLSNHTLDDSDFMPLMSTKDYSYTSMGEILKQMRALRTEVKKEFEALMIHYSYFTGHIEELQV